MRLEHDPDADAVYIYLHEGKVARSLPLDDRRAIDFDAEGRPRGVELLTVSQGVDIRGLPDGAALAALLAEHGIALTGVSAGRGAAASHS